MLRRKSLGWLQCLEIAIGSTVGFHPTSSFAQITPDQTLPTNSNVTSEGNIRIITGGTEVQKNLFHSFKEFSVPTGSEAFFNNGADIQNILTRVTGGSISNIDGLIRANGGANLFLINPNGIVFGPNARLNIGGYFYGTSANSMRFADGSEFSAVNPQSPPLLTINVPLGLQFGNNPGNITVGNDQTEPTADSPTLLEVPTGETLALVGGDVSVNEQRLRAPGGRIELGGLASGGTVGINNDGSLSFPDGVERADVSINGGELDVAAGGGGSIAINAKNLEVTQGSQLFAGIGSGFDTPESQAGDLIINATDTVLFDNSFAYNRVSPGGVGKGGNLSITTGSLEVLNGAFLSASIFQGGRGDAGNIIINANDLVKFDGEYPTGAFSEVFSQAEGKGGDVSITTGSFEVLNGARVSTATFGQGDGGSVTINANDLVKFDGEGEDGRKSGVRSTVGSNAVGNAGGASITARSLEVTNGAQISAATFGQGDAGSVTINANDLVKFDGVGWGGNRSGASSAVGPDAVGNAGGVSISTGSLEALSGAQINASTLGQGNAGNVTINANDWVKFDGQNGGVGSSVGGNAIGNAGGVSINTDSLEVTNGALFSATTFGQGDAGGVSIITGSLEVTNSALVDASAFGQGDAGDLNIKAKSIRLDNDGTISTNTKSVNDDPKNPQANINIQSQDLILRRGSNITANAEGEGVIGGNITINTGVLAGFENSNITANSTDARGGNILINAEGVFGMQFREEDSPLTSDITATGANNELSGNVEIDTTESDPTRGLGEIEADTVDSSTQISDPCVPGGRGFGNSFVSIGRGGLPITPMEPLQDTSTISTWVRLKPQPASRTNQKTTNRKTTNITTSSQPTTVAKTPKAEKQTEAEKPTQIVEATGWIVNAHGNIEFVAQGNHTNPTSTWQNPASCSVSSEK